MLRGVRQGPAIPSGVGSVGVEKGVCVIPERCRYRGVTVKIEPFHAIAISKIAHQPKGEGASIIHMEFGQPSTGAPAPSIERAHQVLDSDPMGYWASAPLKDRIVRLYADRYGVA